MGSTTKHKIVTERGRIKIRRKKSNKSRDEMRGESKRVFKKGTSGGEPAGIEEVRGKTLIGALFWGHIAATQKNKPQKYEFE